MRTRRSPRNQERLFRALFPPAPQPDPATQPARCWTCRHFPKGGRERGRCALTGAITSGRSILRCHVPRPAP